MALTFVTWKLSAPEMLTRAVLCTRQSSRSASVLRGRSTGCKAEAVTQPRKRGTPGAPPASAKMPRMMPALSFWLLIELTLSWTVEAMPVAVT